MIGATSLRSNEGDSLGQRHGFIFYLLKLISSRVQMLVVVLHIITIIIISTSILFVASILLFFTTDTLMKLEVLSKVITN
jgi:hypothetical protein